MSLSRPPFLSHSLSLTLFLLLWQDVAAAVKSASATRIEALEQQVLRVRSHCRFRNRGTESLGKYLV